MQRVPGIFLYTSLTFEIFHNLSKKKKNSLESFLQRWLVEYMRPCPLPLDSSMKTIKLNTLPGEEWSGEQCMWGFIIGLEDRMLLDVWPTREDRASHNSRCVVTGLWGQQTPGQLRAGRPRPVRGCAGRLWERLRAYMHSRQLSTPFSAQKSEGARQCLLWRNEENLGLRWQRIGGGHLDMECLDPSASVLPHTQDLAAKLLYLRWERGEWLCAGNTGPQREALCAREAGRQQSSQLPTCQHEDRTLVVGEQNTQGPHQQASACFSTGMESLTDWIVAPEICMLKSSLLTWLYLEMGSLKMLLCFNEAIRVGPDPTGLVFF